MKIKFARSEHTHTIFYHVYQKLEGTLNFQICWVYMKYNVFSPYNNVTFNQQGMFAMLFDHDTSK